MHFTSFKLPDLADVALRQKPSIEAFVKTAASNISAFIGANRLEFFPEYTDHDVSHLQDVLDLSYSLMTPDSQELLTCEDHAALVLAVMLHDLGMHLTVDGFYTLVADPEWLKPITALGDQPWSLKWQKFLDEARRFDERQLRRLFGETFQPVKNFPKFGDPLGENDRLLVGEFLRRNHHVLAHHIAKFGMPVKEGRKTEILPDTQQVDSAIRDISGLVARSHGTSLRSMFNYLETEYEDRIFPRRTHPIYLMSLLRTSDYLQIQSDRAPLARTMSVSLRSPISNREWNTHQCVKGFRNTVDPETMYIDAEPESVETYARLRWWLDDVQAELDNTWATLGEVYGLQHHSGLNRLGMNLRRVRSNIDDRERLRKKVSYLPEIVRIQANNDQLLKSLIGPLYGDYLGAGLRELLQNSSDAVLEAKEVLRSDDLSDNDRFWDTESDIELRLDLDSNREFSKLTIVDRGVGMTIETIKNYFLNVGASYRNSKEWRNLHASAHSESERLRTGRFGVGVLAGFLIGKTMRVQTRHILSDSNGSLEFSASISDDLIEVRNVEIPFGTRIEIELSSEFKNYLESCCLFDSNEISFSKRRREAGGHDIVQSPGALGDYYGYNPSFSICVDGHTLRVAEAAMLTNERANFFGDPKWHQFNEGNIAVLWSYSEPLPAFPVNKFVVSLNSVALNSGINWEIGCPYLRSPRISIQDRFGEFPLDMRRRGLAVGELPFEKNLIKSITKKFAYDTVTELLHKGIPRADAKKHAALGHFGGWHRSRSGLIPGFPAIFKAMNVRSCFTVVLEDLDASIVSAGQDMLGVYSMQNKVFRSFKDRLADKIEDFFGESDFSSFLGVKPKIVKKCAPLSFFFGPSPSEEEIDRVMSELSGNVRFCDFGPWLTNFTTKDEGLALGDLATRLDNSMGSEKYYVNEVTLDFTDRKLRAGEEIFLEAWLETVGSLELPILPEELKDLKRDMEARAFW